MSMNEKLEILKNLIEKNVPIADVDDVIDDLNSEIEMKDRLLKIMAELILNEENVPYVNLEDMGETVSGKDINFAVDSLIHITREEAELLKKWGVRNLI